MASLFQRFLQYRLRKRAAAKLGFSFHRSRDFRAPSSIRLLGSEHVLHLPDDHGTRIAFLDILLDDCYALRDLPKNIASVVDIGAHAGLFSLAARIRFPRAEIHAYEPNPQMHPLLAQQSMVGRFSVFSEAVGFESGQVSIRPGEDSVHATVLRDSESKIPCISFAEAIRRVKNEPILVKLDCEGSEREILRDAVTWQRVRYLTMEYHLWAGYTLAELRQRMDSMGFIIKSLSATDAEFGVLTAQRRNYVQLTYAVK